MVGHAAGAGMQLGTANASTSAKTWEACGKPKPAGHSPRTCCDLLGAGRKVSGAKVGRGLQLHSKVGVGLQAGFGRVRRRGSSVHRSLKQSQHGSPAFAPSGSMMAEPGSRQWQTRSGPRPHTCCCVSPYGASSTSQPSSSSCCCCCDGGDACCCCCRRAGPVGSSSGSKGDS